MNANVMPAESCTAIHEYCCSKGRCGINPVDFNRDMTTSVPEAVQP